MNRVLLKDKAKAKLRIHYADMLKWVFIYAFLTFAFIGINIEYTQGLTVVQLQLFNIRYTLTPSAISSMFISISSLLAIYSFIVSPALSYGYLNKIKYYALTDYNEFDMFSGFKYNYGKIMILHIMRSIITVLGFLFFIMPGFIFLYQYRYIYEILEEHRDWSWKQIFKASKNITKGHKMELFVLDISFFFWYLLIAILDIITLGFATYLLKPYVDLTVSYAYLSLKEKAGY